MKSYKAYDDVSLDVKQSGPVVLSNHELVLLSLKF